eukprot:scaffold222179_cov52-Prasinocladus_malaysianus.AAC.1
MAGSHAQHTFGGRLVELLPDDICNALALEAGEADSHGLVASSLAPRVVRPEAARTQVEINPSGVLAPAGLEGVAVLPLLGRPIAGELQAVCAGEQVHSEGGLRAGVGHGRHQHQVPLLRQIHLRRPSNPQHLTQSSR